MHGALLLAANSHSCFFNFPCTSFDYSYLNILNVDGVLDLLLTFIHPSSYHPLSVSGIRA